MYSFLLCFFFSHATFHFMAQSFSVMLPFVQDDFLINPVQLGLIITVRELTSGIVSLPGGILSDYFHKHRAMLMAACMVLFGLGWLVISIVGTYGYMLLGMVVIAAASSIWHLPSLVELGIQFSKNRGAVFAVHGSGGSVGDISGPVITGLLLTLISWRSIIAFYCALPIFMSIWIYRIYFRIKSNAADTSRNIIKSKTEFKNQLRVTKSILKRTHIMRLSVVAGVRGMCFAILVTFLPLFMKDNLGFGAKSIGLHFGLLWTLGIVISPLMGHWSDKWGRKIVLIPTLLYAAFIIFLLALYNYGIVFTILIGLLGIAVRSDYSLINASIIDITGDKAATTMLGITSLTRYIMGASAPIIAGLLYQYVGMRAVLFFVSLLFIGAAVIFASVDLTKKADYVIKVHPQEDQTGTY